MKKVFFIVCIIAVFVCGACKKKKHAETAAGPMDGLYKAAPAGVETRWASPENWAGEKGAAAKANSGRKGYASFGLKPGESKVLAEVKNNSGTIRRMWFTIKDRSPEMLRGMKIEIYWDGAEKPAVSAPMGDFFCHNVGQMSAFENGLFSSGEGRSFNCYIPMPFRTGMKAVLTNEAKSEQRIYFDIDYTIGDKHPDDMLYFHAYYRRENPTTLQKDYEFLPKVEGRGRFLGVSVGMIADTKQYFKSWWGEGEAKYYIDGDTEYPTLSGTGTEDYIGSAWGQARFINMYQGCPVADHNNMHYSFYRFHVPDPVYFNRDIRVTMQQIGNMGGWQDKMRDANTVVYRATGGRKQIDLKAGGKGLFEREDDWSSCAYFYLDKPTNNLPAIDPVEKRLISSVDGNDIKK